MYKYQKTKDKYETGPVSIADSDHQGLNQLLQWNDDYAIGVQEIDDEHRSIIERYSILYELMKDGHGHEYYGELILFLNDYVNDHFNHEEQLQKKLV